MKYLEKIQILLPLGYLYLILLGLLNESIQYHQLGINILNYSSITDILISPISEIFSSPKLIIVIVVLFGFFFVIQFLLVKNSHTTLAQKILGNRFNQDTGKKEIQKFIFPFVIMAVALELLAIFVGLGIAGGDKISKKISKNDFSYNYTLNFSSGKSKNVYMFDLNSTYCFYVTKENKHIQIAPVETISNLELISNKN